MKSVLILVLSASATVLPIEAGLSASGTSYTKTQSKESVELAQARLPQAQLPEGAVLSQESRNSFEQVALAALTLGFSLRVIQSWNK